MTLLKDVRIGRLCPLRSNGARLEVFIHPAGVGVFFIKLSVEPVVLHVVVDLLLFFDVACY